MTLYSLAASAEIIEKTGIHHSYNFNREDVQSMGSLLFGNYSVTQFIRDSLSEY